MTRPLPILLAAVLGVLAALGVAACGSTEGGIPQSRADRLLADIEDVLERTEGGNCDELDGQLRQVQQRVDNLPESVDTDLVANLQSGVDRLRSVAVEDCSEEATQTDTTEDTAPQTDTQTETVPTTETTEPPPDTPTETEPGPTPDPLEPEPVPEPVPDPGGGGGDDGGSGGASPPSPGAGRSPAVPGGASG